MAGNILVIGGSYFVGRVFCILASRERFANVSVVNRGRFSLDMPGISEYQCDRHDTAKLSTLLPSMEFDAIIDLCAYAPGDIRQILDLYGDHCKRYVYVSTASVYQPTSQVKTEDSPLLTAWTDDPVSAYIRQKLQLEDELITNAAAHQAEHTILRPSFIFGPYNYAPRESWFIQRIVTGKPIPVPVDATAEYSMVYVTDVARALMLAAIEPGAANTIFNLAAPEHITYQTLLSELERCNGAPFAQTPVSVAQVLDENIPLPFPLNDNDLTSAKLFTDAFIFHWTPFSEAMDKTFAAFKSVFSAS